MDIESILIRKERLEKRLLDYGLKEYQNTNLSYLEFDPEKFATPIEIARRIIILYSTFHVACNLNDIEEIKKWLIKENLWEDLSDIEKELFNGEIEDEEKLSEFSWNIEKVYILAWTLNIVDDTPEPTNQITDTQFENLINNIPPLGKENLLEFFNNQQLRDRNEIYDESLFSELITAYFRDLYCNGQDNQTSLDPNSTHERHFALNWVRRFSGIENWEETDTST